MFFCQTPGLGLGVDFFFAKKGQRLRNRVGEPPQPKAEPPQLDVGCCAPFSRFDASLVQVLNLKFQVFENNTLPNYILEFGTDDQVLYYSLSLHIIHLMNSLSCLFLSFVPNKDCMISNNIFSWQWKAIDQPGTFSNLKVRLQTLLAAR